jgi:hypothetical protein
MPPTSAGDAYMQVMPPDQSLSLLQALRGACYAAFAFVAGGLGYILRNLDAGTNISYVRAFIEALSSALVGLLTMWICESLGLSQQWTAVSVGVAGWLGANASIQVLQRLVWNKLGLYGSEKR